MSRAYSLGVALREPLTHTYHKVIDALGGKVSGQPQLGQPNYDAPQPFLNIMGSGFWKQAAIKENPTTPREGFRARVTHLFERLPAKARQAGDATTSFYNGIGSKVAYFSEYARGAFDAPVYRATASEAVVVARPNLTRSLFYAGLLGIVALSAGCGKASQEDLSAANTKIEELEKKIGNYATTTSLNNAVSAAKTEMTNAMNNKLGGYVKIPTAGERAAATKAAEARRKKFREEMAADVTRQIGTFKTGYEADKAAAAKQFGDLQRDYKAGQEATTKRFGELSTEIKGAHDQAQRATQGVETLARDYQTFAAETRRRIGALEPKKQGTADQSNIPPADVGTSYDPTDIIRAPVVRPKRSLQLFGGQ